MQLTKKNWSIDKEPFAHRAADGEQGIPAIENLHPAGRSGRCRENRGRAIQFSTRMASISCENAISILCLFDRHLFD
jgi:hypothetical protein